MLQDGSLASRIARFHSERPRIELGRVASRHRLALLDLNLPVVEVEIVLLSGGGGHLNRQRVAGRPFREGVDCVAIPLERHRSLGDGDTVVDRHRVTVRLRGRRDRRSPGHDCREQHGCSDRERRDPVEGSVNHCPDLCACLI